LFSCKYEKIKNSFVVIFIFFEDFKNSLFSKFISKSQKFKTAFIEEIFKLAFILASSSLKSKGFTI
jgi:hypothetical protein